MSCSSIILQMLLFTERKQLKTIAKLKNVPPLQSSDW